MLIFSRKKHEKVVIDGGIEVVVIEIRGDKVRLGFKAPKEVTVDRGEVHQIKMESGHADNASQPGS